jgi:pimeloyl-ACP methyl ester carboxylesterase
MSTRPIASKDVALSDSFRMRYYEWPGEGPNLVFLHPSTGYGRMWEPTVEGLGSRFHVYAPDQRGHGDSPKPVGAYSAEEYADDLLLLFDKLGIERAAIVGHSLGGRVGLVFAARHPERVQALLFSGGPHPSNFFLTRELAIKVLDAVSNYYVRPVEFPSRQAAEEFLRTNFSWPEAAIQHRLDYNTEPRGAGIAFKYDPVWVAQGLAHMANDLRPYAAQAACPVAILRGTYSSELSAPEADRIVSCFRDCKVIEVEGDYWLELENPTGLAEAISQFVAGVTESPALASGE